MSMNSESRRMVGFACLAASIGVLVFQQTIGQYIGIGVMALWLVLGAVGIWLLGPGSDES